MKACCSTTASSITEILLAGDVLINLTEKKLNVVQGTVFIETDGHSLRRTGVPVRMDWRPELADHLTGIPDAGVSRIVVVSEDDCPISGSVIEALSVRGIPCLHCVLMDTCASEDYLADEDAELVSERLRQLGYL